MASSDAITSRSNPLIKSVRSLKERKSRDRAGKFLVEGILHVGEAIAAGWEIDVVLYSPELLESAYALNLVEDAKKIGLRCSNVSADVFESIAEKENPQGIAAVVVQRTTPLDSFSKGYFKTLVALVAPQDPGNIGTILRSIDATGADGLILLDGGADPYHPSAVRASMGTIFWKPLAIATFTEFHQWVSRKRVLMIGTSAHAVMDYRNVKRDDEPIILLLGNEQKGLTKGQLEICNVVVSMPMRGRASSLNLAVAAGILLYQFIN